VLRRWSQTRESDSAGPGIIVKQEPKQYTGAGMTRLVMSAPQAQGSAGRGKIRFRRAE
jgi:hypothetical protein